MSRRYVLLAAVSLLSSCSARPSWTSASDLVVEPRNVLLCIVVRGADTIPLSSCVCTFPAGLAPADSDTSPTRR